MRVLSYLLKGDLVYVWDAWKKEHIFRTFRFAPNISPRHSGGQLPSLKHLDLRQAFFNGVQRAEWEFLYPCG